MKEGIGRIIVTRIGIIEDRTREVTGITIVFPIVESVVNNGLNLLSVNSNWQFVVKGALLIIAIITDALSTNLLAKKQTRTH